MSSLLRAALYALSLNLLALSAGGAGAQTGAKAWSAGKIYVPASLSTAGPDCESTVGGACEKSIKPGKHPVIVFLHGCGGPRKPIPFLGLGAIVVAPNSFAAGTKCVADAGATAKLVKQRHGDIAYAVTQLKGTTWADPAKLVLAGYSNGAQTSATYPGDEFKARVIVAWTCNNVRVPEQNGVKGKGPVLALLGTADEFFKKIGLSGNCNDYVKGRGEGSQSILIPGGTHDIADHPTTRDAVAKFIPVVLR